MSVIDCNVYVPADQQGIARYTDPVWSGWHPIIPPFPYRTPRPWPLGAGAQPDEIRSDVLEGMGAELVVLGGSLHPGDAVTQFEYHAAFTRAYNDWLAEEWLASDERFYGSIQVMSQEPEEAAREIERWGPHPRMLQVVLPARGGEGFGLGRYRPIFEAAARHDLVIALQPSASTRTATGVPESVAEWHAGMSQSFMGQILSLVFSGVFEEHPNLRVLVCGAGFTWLPYLMWQMDSNYRPLRAEVPWLKRLPSEQVPSHLYFTANPIPEAPAAHLREMIDMAGFDEWLVFGSGYPTRGWVSPDTLAGAGFPDELRQRVLTDNARRLYGDRLARIGAAG